MRMQMINSLIRYLVHPFLDIIYPPLCHNCDCLLPPDRTIICRECWLQIGRFKGELDTTLAGRSFDNIFILFEYGPVVRALIHLLKYKRYLGLCHHLSQEAGVRFPNFGTTGYTAVVPVPLHKTRKRERGYNQSEEIGRAIARQFNLDS